jgi:hypothetical protein
MTNKIIALRIHPEVKSGLAIAHGQAEVHQHPRISQKSYS